MLTNLSAQTYDQEVTLSWEKVDKAAYSKIFFTNTQNKKEYEKQFKNSDNYAVIDGLSNDIEYEFFIKVFDSKDDVLAIGKINAIPSPD